MAPQLHAPTAACCEGHVPALHTYVYMCRPACAFYGTTCTPASRCTTPACTGGWCISDVVAPTAVSPGCVMLQRSAGPAAHQLATHPTWLCPLLLHSTAGSAGICAGGDRTLPPGMRHDLPIRGWRQLPWCHDPGSWLKPGRPRTSTKISVSTFLSRPAAAAAHDVKKPPDSLRM